MGAKQPEGKDPFAVSLGARIKEARERAGMTQRALSRAAKYDAVQLSRVESGDAIPRADAMLRIAVALRTPIARLYGLPEGVSMLPAVRPDRENSAGVIKRLDAVEQALDANIPAIFAALQALGEGLGIALELPSQTESAKPPPQERSGE
jgi:transcriptional regulator with XRE-family HTH domain